MRRPRPQRPRAGSPGRAKAPRRSGQAVRALPAPLAHTPCVDGAEVLAAASAGTRLAASRESALDRRLRPDRAEIATRRSEERIDMLALEGEGERWRRSPDPWRAAGGGLALAGRKRPNAGGAGGRRRDRSGGRRGTGGGAVHPWNKLVYRLDGRECRCPVRRTPASSGCGRQPRTRATWPGSPPTKEESARVWDVIADRPWRWSPGRERRWPTARTVMARGGVVERAAPHPHVELARPGARSHQHGVVPRPLLAFSASGDALVLVDASRCVYGNSSLKQLGSAPAIRGTASAWPSLPREICWPSSSRRRCECSRCPRFARLAQAADRWARRPWIRLRTRRPYLAAAKVSPGRRARSDRRDHLETGRARRRVRSLEARGR
jgi:hypothetical protein